MQTDLLTAEPIYATLDAAVGRRETLVDQSAI